MRVGSNFNFNFKSARLRPLVEESIVPDSTWHKDSKDSTYHEKGKRAITNGKVVPCKAPPECPQTCDISQKRDKILEGVRRLRPQSAPPGIMIHQERWSVGNAYTTFGRWGLRQGTTPESSSCLGKSGGNEDYRNLAVIGQNTLQFCANASCGRAKYHKVTQQIPKEGSDVENKIWESHHHRTPASPHRKPQQLEEDLLSVVQEKGAVDDFRKPSINCFSTLRPMIHDSPSSYGREKKTLESEEIRCGDDSVQERFYESTDGTMADGGTKVEKNCAQIHGVVADDIPQQQEEEASTTVVVCLPAKGVRFGSWSKETLCATHTLPLNRVVKPKEISEGTLHRTMHHAELPGNNPSEVSLATKALPSQQVDSTIPERCV